ncbi:NLR family CARD domain-containing protein 3-like isoform X2 [Paramisgurnus dabryanus]|uniref:NLR family CARD domain-containing protein 3-like isoform X2 n=1 Tax=Paramisgurnus dabryanus TaxID=90735 RepID=UPI0031F3772E
MVSLKSDKSMNMPIHLNNGDDQLVRSFGERSYPDSSVPSMVSLKSDKSMNMPIHLKSRQPSPEQGSKKKQDLTAPKVLFIKYYWSTDTNRSQRHDRPSRLKSRFKKNYQCVFEGLAKQGNPTLLNKIYTELYITESESGEISNEHEVRQIDIQSRRPTTEETPIKCNDIFKPLPEQHKHIRSVLTKGVAGIGKTVSVQKFILDWAEEKENQDVHLIFPLPFREINLMKDKTLSLLDLLHLFFPETKEMEIFSDEYKVLFIFDGLDECRLSLDFKSKVKLCDVCKSTSMDVMLTNLIKGNLFPSARIWITSRPAAADLIPSECVDRITEVRGFSDPQKEEYFRKRITDESLSDQIISHLKSSRSLYIMCHIPVFCWISVTVLERILREAERREIPKTLTQMYTHFLKAQISIKRKKYSQKDDTDKVMIFKLGKLAFEQLMKGNLIFYDEDLRECGIDVAEASVYSGLCTQIFREEFGLYQGKVYCFVHLTIQEHLAALYVHLSFINNNRNVFDQESENPLTMFSLHKCAIDKALQSNSGHLDLLLRFLMGFSMESNHNLLKGLLVKRPHDFQEREKTIEYLKEKIKSVPCTNARLIIFYCLCELNDHSLTDEIQRYLNLTSGKLNPEHMNQELWSALVFILIVSDEKLDKFNLSKYGRSDDILYWMNPLLKLSTKAQLQDCNITVDGCAWISFAITPFSNLRELDLSHNNIQDSGVEMLCVGVRRSRHTKPEVKEKALIPRYASDHVLHRHHNNNADQIRFKYCSAGLQDTVCNLEYLKLKDCGVTEDGCVQLSSALRSNPSHLRELDLSWNHVGDSGVKHLCDVLEKTECGLQILKLNKCGITAEGCAALASALRSNTSGLIELDLSDNNLGDSGVKLLSNGLKNSHCKLKILRLSSCSVTKNGAAALAEALKSNPSHLTELNIKENHLKVSDIHIFSMIQDKVHI